MNLFKKIIIILIITLIVFIIKINILNQPFFWDDMGGIITPALDMFENNFCLIHPYRNFGHPPFLHICLALIWKIFGYSILSSHIFIILVGVVGLYYTFRIGNDFFNFWVGLGATVLLFFNQLFFAQIGIINDSIPLLTLGIITVYYYLKDKKLLVFLFASLLVLTKETGALLIFAIFIHWFIKNISTLKQTLKQEAFLTKLQEKKYPNRVESIKKIFEETIVLIKKSWFLTGPIIFLLLWFTFHQIKLGWFLRVDLIYHQTDFWMNLNKNFIINFYYDFTNNNINKFNFILLFFIIINIVKYRIKILKTTSLFFLIIFLYLVLFSFTDDLPRYFTVILPFFYIISSEAVYSIYKKIKFNNIFFVFTILLCSFIFSLNYQGDRIGPGFKLDSNLEYNDFIYVSKQATDYIEKKYSNNNIVTYWPMTDQLNEPKFGYISKKINRITDTTENFRSYIVPSVDAMEEFNPNSILITDDTIFYYTFPPNNFFVKIIENKNIEIIKIFKKNNKSSILFKINK